VSFDSAEEPYLSEIVVDTCSFEAPDLLRAPG
jgi:hypothetical protein